jgi:glycosyltransferase involved in cell wall biosynthesis
MKIGIDLSPLQGDHRMRGIGFTLRHFINNIDAATREQHDFVFYTLDPSTSFDPFTFLDVKAMNYEVRTIGTRKIITKRMPGRLGMMTSALNQLLDLRDYYFGDSRINNLNNLDVFLQADQSQSLPRNGSFKKFLIIYDIIPYVLSSDYLWSYRDARNKGFSRKAGVRYQLRRLLYVTKLRASTHRADGLIAISEHTKQDFVNHLAVPAKKIDVIPLGVTTPEKKPAKKPELRRFQASSWGYIRRPFSLEPKTPFILFVGGADRRRRIDELVAAFNLIRAEGKPLKLVLVGDRMQGADRIDTPETRYALNNSPYQDDIVFLGFVDDATRDWLYTECLAFVFPSIYEGFGLPVLEAMSYGTPVIAYDCAAVREVAEDAPLYATDQDSLLISLTDLMGADQHNLEKFRAKSLKQAAKYNWPKTSQKIIQSITSKAV